MIQSLFSGASGLKAQQTQMDVIGNNIANINTVGFKAGRAEFKQTLSSTLSQGVAGSDGAGGSDPVQLGMGVTVGDIGSVQTQGSLQYTGRSLDVAIEGNGFLTLDDGSGGQFFTRDGSLTVDSNGNLVSASNAGFSVTGWNADSTGKVDSTGALKPIQLPLGQMSMAKQTSQVSFDGNLDATVEAGTDVSTSSQVYDSLGQAHALNVTFTKGDNPGEWSWKATSPDGSFSPDTGTVTFDANGKVSDGGLGAPQLTLAGAGGAAPAGATPQAANGANAAIALNLDFGSITALSGDGKSTVTPAAQDGLAQGVLTGYSIDPSGVITGTFSNGMSQAIAQIALSNFANPNGLTKVGGNVFSQAPNSGSPQVGTAESGGRGKLSSGFLEMSNVDLSTEFTNMIVAQRGFQANSKIITTSDEMLQELLSLKR
jgi:flagellar hook protein FlgE